jgi:hypothetical protein
MWIMLGRVWKPVVVCARGDTKGIIRAQLILPRMQRGYDVDANVVKAIEVLEKAALENHVGIASRW